MITMKKILFNLLTTSFLFIGAIEATIYKIQDIQEIIKEVNSETLVLFNVAEVLMDTQTSLGTQAWRKFLRTRVDAKTHDELTLFVFQNIPAKVPEEATSLLINEWQFQGVPVLAFTSRGRHEWYSTQTPDIDLMTENQLKALKIDFAKTQLPPQLSSLQTLFSDYYHEGIIYTTNSLDKGELLQHILNATGYMPPKIVFVDDKAPSLKEVETALEKTPIEFIGFAYERTSRDHASFDPMIANIQLDWLITYGQVLSDDEATQIKNEQFANVSPDDYLMVLVQKWNDR